MSDALKSRSAKRRTNRKAASEALFDPAAFLETTASGRVISTHSKKDVIFAQGEDADSVFYIRKGKVKVAIVSKQGKEAVIALLGPDEFVGEGCLIGQPKRFSSSTQPKNGLRGCYCYWPILERKAERSQFSQRSVRRHSLR